MSWLDKIPQKIKRVVDSAKKKNVPEGLWSKCESCMTVLYKTDLDRILKFAQNARITTELVRVTV